MKKIVCFPILIALLIVAQQGIAQNVSITGKIEQPKGGQIIFQELGLPFLPIKTKNTEVDASGQFKIELDVQTPSYYLLTYNRRRFTFFLHPNDRLHITFKSNGIDGSIKFEGEGAVPNNYLQKKNFVELTRKIYDKTYFGMTYKEFITKSDAYKAKIGQALEDFKANEDTKKYARFIELEEADIYAKWATLHVKYAPYRAFYNKKNPKEVWATVDMETLKAMNVNQAQLLASKTYRDFLKHYASMLTDHQLVTTASEGTRYTEEGLVNAMYLNANQFFSDPEIVEYIKTRVIYDHITKKGINGIEPAIVDFDKTVKKTNYRGYIKSNVDKWAHLRTGAEAPDFTGMTNDGKTVKLSDLKGQFVYIDVWATWCGPCRREIPNLEKAYEAYHDKGIAFMSVSIDKDKKRWEQFLQDNNMVGNQIYTPGGWGAPINKQYNITGIPRFLLVDKEGKIITVNAPRPSQGIGGVFEKLLKQG